MIENLIGLSIKDIKVIVDECIISMNERRETSEVDELVEALKGDTRSSVLKLVLKCEKAINKLYTEIERVNSLYSFDMSKSNGVLMAGVDEVGRGPLAGPIVAAAVVLDYSKIDKDSILFGINDSKKIKEAIREKLYDEIKKHALDYRIVQFDNNTIDKNGIAWCNNESFKEAVLGLKIKVDKVLCDGYPIKNFHVESEAVIKGDTKSAAIACASILAKVYRDRLMKEYALKYPEYDFENNVGYGTAKHLDGLRKNGYTDIHRLSFIKAYR